MENKLVSTVFRFAMCDLTSGGASCSTRQPQICGWLKVQWWDREGGTVQAADGQVRTRGKLPKVNLWSGKVREAHHGVVQL